ncbi:MAG TPA: hypothetical protein DDX98_00205 [Bacteroidales bacterium]|jgi:hypothetical protein|nr:hypothetical protein [Bacteroidales bacterium]
MEVKGTAVIAIRDFVKRNYPDQFTDWLNELSDDAKAIYGNTIDSTQWYPVECGAKEPTEKIGKMFFNGDIKEGAMEAGRYSAEKALTGIYKIFVKAANPQYIIKRASRVFATYYRPCEIQVVDVPKNGVVVEMTKVTERYEAIERRILGWMYMALEISGCQGVNITNELVREEAEGKVVKFDMRWN